MRPDERILEAAASWFDRLQNDDPTEEDVAAWQRWIAEDPAHRKAFDRLQDTWQRFEGVPAPALASAGDRLADAYDGSVSVAEWNRRRPVAGGRRRWRVLALAASVVLGVVIGFVVWQGREQSHGGQVAAYETRSSEHRTVRLPDGSTIAIGARSLVWVRMEPRLREVLLDRGEAYFEVAKDARRPFVVRAGTASITAVGTAFNVRKAGEQVQVLVSEGSVNVDQADSAPAATSSAPRARVTPLSAGHRWVSDPASEAGGKVTTAAVERASSWRTGQLQYIGEPLKYVVEDVNRYSKLQISIADPQLGQIPVTGTVFENDIEGWLASIGEFIPVRVERVGDAEVVLHGK